MQTVADIEKPLKDRIAAVEEERELYRRHGIRLEQRIAELEAKLQEVTRERDSHLEAWTKKSELLDKWQSIAGRLERTYKSIYTILGWLNEPPPATIERELCLMKERIAAIPELQAKLTEQQAEIERLKKSYEFTREVERRYTDRWIAAWEKFREAKDNAEATTVFREFLNEKFSDERISETVKQLETAEAKLSKVREAAQRVISRWDSPDWKEPEHTGELIHKLREAIDG